MRKTIKKLAPALIVALMAVSLLSVGVASAQEFGPPAGFEGMMGPPAGFDMSGIPEGFDMSNIPDMSSIPDMSNMPSGTNMGPPANMEEMQSKGEAAKQRGLSQMRRGAKGMLKGVAQMEKAIAGSEKAGYPVAESIKEATAKAKVAAATIETTNSIEEALAAIDDFNAFVDVLDANIEPLSMLANFPRILKQATRTLEKLQKEFDKMKAKAAKVSDVDLSENINGIQATIDTLTAVYTQSQDLAKAGDAVGAFDKLENEYFEPMQDAYQSVGMLQAALNISKAVRSVDKGIKSAEKVIVKLKKKKIDTAPLQTIVDQAKAKAVELKAFVKVKDFDPDAAVDLLEELNDLRSNFEDKVDELLDGETQGIKDVKFFTTPAVVIPKEFTSNGPDIDKMEF